MNQWKEITFLNVNCGKILSRSNMRSHEFTLESVVLHVVWEICFVNRSGLHCHLKDECEHVKNFKCQMYARKFAGRHLLDDHR